MQQVRSNAKTGPSAFWSATEAVWFGAEQWEVPTSLAHRWQQSAQTARDDAKPEFPEGCMSRETPTGC